MDLAAATKTNDGVLEFLRYYVDPARELDYAVLVAGPWGSGKTHLAKAFLKSVEVKPLYVSLYGLTSTSQIDEELYRQLHPLLASKGMKVFSAIARGALKGTLRIDLDGDGKDEGTWTAGIPEIDLTKELSNPRERLLVFDDLERVKMPVSEVLGYINSFVEHDGVKAIILANEEEIVRHVDSRYPDIKEKLIGQTLTIAAPADTAFDAFLTTIRNPETAAFLRAHKADVLALHTAGGLNNLRMLKQSMWDFERIARHFEERHWEQPAAILKILNVVLALSLEHRSGRMKPDQIPRLVGNSFGRMLRSQATKETYPEGEFEDRYPQINFDDVVLDAGVLNSVIARGESDGDRIRAALDADRHYATQGDQPLWLRAWNAFVADDATVDALVIDFENAFARREFNGRSELMHVFGIRLWLAQLGLVARTGDQVVAECEAYIDDLDATGRLVGTLDEKEGDINSAYSTRSTMEADTPNFHRIADYYGQAAMRSSERQYLNLALGLLDRLETSQHEAMLDLVPNNIRASAYYDVPLLAALPPAYVAQRILGSTPENQIQTLQTLGSRHEVAPLERLAAEQPWLAALEKELKRHLASAHPMTRHRLSSSIARGITPAVERYAAQQALVEQRSRAAAEVLPSEALPQNAGDSNPDS